MFELTHYDIAWMYAYMVILTLVAGFFAVYSAVKEYTIVRLRRELQQTKNSREGQNSGIGES